MAVEMTTRKPSRQAIFACARFLQACISFGWSRDHLDYLEELWWRYHDDRGNESPLPLSVE